MSLSKARVLFLLVSIKNSGKLPNLLTHRNRDHTFHENVQTFKSFGGFLVKFPSSVLGNLTRKPPS